MKNKNLVIILILMSIVCYGAGCVTTSSGVKDAQPVERTDLFTYKEHQMIGTMEIAVFHDNERNVTIYMSCDGLTAIPDWMLNSPYPELQGNNS